MARPAILVVDREEGRRRELARGLTSYGYEVAAAATAEQGERFAGGLAPGLVAAEAALVRPEDPFGLRALARAAGTAAPTVVLFGGPEADEPAEGIVHVGGADIAAAELLQRIRTALLARELGIAAAPGLAALVGELERVPLFELLPLLQRSVATGAMELTGGTLALEDGEVVAARAGDQSGVKAFARLARTATGPFRLVLGEPCRERQIFKDLLSLMAIALEDRSLFEEASSTLPGLSRRLRPVMGPVFFATQFSPGQQRVLEAAQSGRTAWQVLDRVPLPDGEALSDLAQLFRLGIVEAAEPEVEVRVVTDSAADLPSEVAERLRIEVVPLQVSLAGRSFRHLADLPPSELYRVLASRAAHRQAPRVEPPGTGELESVYRHLVGRSDVVSLHVSERLSGAIANARAAVESGAAAFAALRGDGSPRVEVVDSGSAGVGQALLAVAAGRMALRKVGAGEIRTRLEALRGRVHTLFVADGLDLAGGRVRFGRARVWLGRLLGFQPILALADGGIVLLDGTRTERTAQPRLVELLAGRVEGGRPVMACLAHAVAPVRAVRLRALLHEAFRVSELIEGEIGPLLGTMLGPRCVAVALLQPTADEEPLLSPVFDGW